MWIQHEFGIFGGDDGVEFLALDDVERWGIAALHRAAARGPVAVASGSPRVVIGTVLEPFMPF
mgnify:CR=1 FL=1